MRELSIHDVRDLLRRYGVVLLIAVVTSMLVAGSAFFFMVPDQYTATTVLYVMQIYGESSGSTYLDATASTVFAADYQLLIETKPVINETLERLNLDSLDDVRISISTTAGTRVLNVNVMGTDPKHITNVANTISTVFIKYIEGLTGFSAAEIAAEAEVPTRISGPARMRNTVLVGMGMFILGFIIMLLRHLLDNTFTEGSELADRLRVPLLSSVEDYKKEIDAYMHEGRGGQSALYDVVTESTAESIKTLATNIHFCSGSRPVKSLVVTSTVPNEGKSSIAMMLATVLATEGRNVLIVDMDFRNPTIGSFLKHRNQYDLVDLFTSQVSLEDVIHQCPTTGVSFIDAVHKNIVSTQVVQTEWFSQFLMQVADYYDMVIFDTPPLGLYIDAAILAAMTDGTILVVGSGASDRRHVRDALDQLTKANANVLGAVLNFVKKKSSGSYYYQKYGYYAAQAKNKKKRG